MPLKKLRLCITPVKDISVLKGMPLTSLAINATRVTDVSALAGMELETLAIDPKNITKGIDVIRNMKTLTTILDDYDRHRTARGLSPGTIRQEHKLLTAFIAWLRTVHGITGPESLTRNHLDAYLKHLNDRKTVKGLTPYTRLTIRDLKKTHAKCHSPDRYIDRQITPEKETPPRGGRRTNDAIVGAAI